MRRGISTPILDVAADVRRLTYLPRFRIVLGLFLYKPET
jgi:hypothetical protein